MEKHLLYNGFEAWITVDEKTLPQYGEEYDGVKKEARCWVPSETDQAFSVKYHKIIAEECDYVASVQLDGIEARKVQCIGGCSRALITTSYIRLSRDECKNFMFGSVEMTDDDAYLDSSSSSSVGEIRLTLTKVKVIRKIPTQAYDKHTLPPAEIKVHERSKKGVSHQVKYGPTVKSTKNRSRKYEYTSLEVIASFVFRYRPLALLQANGIVPRGLPLLQPENEVNEIPNIPGPSVNVKAEPDDGQDDLRESIVAKAESEQIQNAERALASGKVPRKKLKDEPTNHFTQEKSLT